MLENKNVKMALRINAGKIKGYAVDHLFPRAKEGDESVKLETRKNYVEKHIDHSLVIQITECIDPFFYK